MLSSKTLNQNLLNIRYFLKKSPSSGAPLPGSSDPTHTHCTTTKRLNFVAHKKSILISKIWGDFSVPFLYDFAPSLQLVWQRH